MMKAYNLYQEVPTVQAVGELKGAGLLANTQTQKRQKEECFPYHRHLSQYDAQECKEVQRWVVENVPREEQV